MTNIKVYKCFIASPNDVAAEREVCDKVFSEINKTIGEYNHFRIESIKWENDTRPGVGTEVQEVIFSQVGDFYEIFIGIMYKKFGTPTKNAGSGTEAEFNNAYERWKNGDEIEILFYFNNQSPENLNEIDPHQLIKVNDFKDKIGREGVYYNQYNGINDFEAKLRSHLSQFFQKKKLEINSITASNPTNLPGQDKQLVLKLLEKRLEEALCSFSTQPIIWIEPILSNTNEISQNPNDNFNNRIALSELIQNPKSTIIKAPPLFGLTCLSYFLVKEAWKKNFAWIYLDSVSIKSNSVEKAVNKEIKNLGIDFSQVKCIILDSWTTHESDSIRKLKNLCERYENIPIIVMHTIDDSRFQESSHSEKIKRDFQVLHLLALPRTHIRQIVSAYNKIKVIEDEDKVLSKVISDLEMLNIHRTPLNCLTLLKVSEKYFDESPVNRTKMLEMVLFILFNTDGIPTYKAKPDLKDCEYVLGSFAEKMIRSNIYEFTREEFLSTIDKYCKDKLIDLEVDVVFDVLFQSHIIIKRENTFVFRATYWILYFAAKKMHSDSAFVSYVFESQKYIDFPEIIEFYTGINRDRADALKVLLNDLRATREIVHKKVALPNDMNPFRLARWNSTTETLTLMQKEISEGVLNSKLPDDLKDRYADKSYNQMKPYNQSIQTFLQEYSLIILWQKIKATARALRNSDYVDPNLKKEVLLEIMRSWEEISKVLLALTPILAVKGFATFEGAGFFLDGDFGATFKERVQNIISVLPKNVVGFFKDDLYSAKMGPLLYYQISNAENELTKHQLILLTIIERPKSWKKQVEEYIISISPDSFYLYDVLNTLRVEYQFGFASDKMLQDLAYLIKMVLAKHNSGLKKPGVDKIVKVSNKNLPPRELNEEQNKNAQLR